MWVRGSYIRPAGHQHAALITAQKEGKALHSTCRTSYIFMLHGLTYSLLIIIINYFFPLIAMLRSRQHIIKEASYTTRTRTVRGGSSRRVFFFFVRILVLFSSASI